MARFAAISYPAIAEFKPGGPSPASGFALATLSRSAGEGQEDPRGKALSRTAGEGEPLATASGG